jgi:hypothetical protein
MKERNHYSRSNPTLKSTTSRFRISRSSTTILLSPNPLQRKMCLQDLCGVCRNKRLLKSIIKTKRNGMNQIHTLIIRWSKLYFRKVSKRLLTKKSRRSKTSFLKICLQLITQAQQKAMRTYVEITSPLR